MRSLWRLRPFLRPYQLPLALAAVCFLGLTAIELVLPAILRQVVDVGLSEGGRRVMLAAGLAVLGLGLLHAVLAFGQRYLSEWVSHHVAFDLRNRLFDHIQHLPFAFHDHTQSGQLISRCIEDVRSIQNFTGQGILEIARISVLLVGIVLLLAAQNPRLAAIALLPMIPLILATSRFGQRISRFFLAVDNALGELSSRLQENVTGVQVVRAFAREPHEIRRFDQANRTLFQARIRVIGEWSKIMPTTTFLVTIATILILWFGGRMVLAGEITLGQLAAFNGYLLLLATPAHPLRPAARRGRVEFRRASLRYRGGSLPALHDVDLRVEPNQIVALVGPTGSGKSTLVNLIPRFYDVSSGAVLVDGVDVRSLELSALRRQVGIVLQTSLLFSTTLRENIAYGRPDAGLDEVVAAAEAAQAHEFIVSLPAAYDTVVGERGVTLSGGQRQRVAIARALLLDPRILILDDSTSSVDTETEHRIRLALDRLMQGRTTFIIAQRLSTIRRADLILVMQGGRVVERGVHSELLARDGFYRQIYELQLKDQDLWEPGGEAAPRGPEPPIRRQPEELRRQD